MEAGKQRQDVATRDFLDESGWWSLAAHCGLYLCTGGGGDLGFWRQGTPLTGHKGMLSVSVWVPSYPGLA